MCVCVGLCRCVLCVRACTWQIVMNMKKVLEESTLSDEAKQKESLSSISGHRDSP